MLIIAAEIAIKGEEQDPEYIASAASSMVRAAIANLVAQVLQQSGDSSGNLMKKVGMVRVYCSKIKKKVDSIARQKWLVANPVKKGNKMVVRMNANQKLNNFRKELEDAERARKQFKRK